MSLNKMTILFVEDDHDTHEHIKMILQEDVKEFFQAYDGEEGLTVFREKNPDIIITDLNMPNFSGLELTKKIKEIDNSKAVIIMSAFDDRENLLNSINLGSNGFIPKPVDISLLYQQLHTIAKKIQTQHEQKEQMTQELHKLYKLAHYNSLTETANENLFNIELKKSIKYANEQHNNFALFCISVEPSKSSNEIDEDETKEFILKNIANKLNNFISYNDFIAHKSNDDFLLIINNAPYRLFLEETAEKIIKQFKQPIEFKDKAIQLFCNIGITVYPKDSYKQHTLLKLADTALYHAKNLENSNYCFAENIFQQEDEKKEKKIIINDELYWDIAHSYFIYKNRELVLTRNELYFLSLLFSSPNYRATYEDIHIKIWNTTCLSKRKNLKTLVKMLRKKLPVDIIQNIFNIGYKLEF